MCIPARKLWSALAFASALALAACASAPAGWRAEPSGDMTYLPLNLRFAPQFEALRRTAVRSADAQGTDVAVDYEAVTEPVSLSLRLYPRPDETPDAHFKALLERLQAERTEAKVEVARRGAIDLGKNKVLGFVAAVAFPKGKAHSVTCVWLVPAGERFVSVRTSVVDADREASLKRAVELSARFLATLPLAVQ